MPSRLEFGGGSGGSSSGSGGWSPFQLLNKSSELIKSLGWTGLGKAGVGTFFLSIVLMGTSFLQALIQLPITLLEALGVNIAALNQAFIAGPAQFLIEGLSAGAAAFGSGWTGILGPLQGPFAVGITAIMLWEGLYFLDVVNSDFFGVVLDLPFLQNDESAAAGDEGE